MSTSQFFQQGPSGQVTQVADAAAPGVGAIFGGEQKAAVPVDPRKRNLVQIYVNVARRLLAEVALRIKTPQASITKGTALLDSLLSTHGDNLRIYNAAPLAAALGGLFMQVKIDGTKPLGEYAIGALTAKTEQEVLTISSKVLNTLRAVSDTIHSHDQTAKTRIDQLVAVSIGQLDTNLQKYALPQDVLAYMSVYLLALMEMIVRWQSYNHDSRLQLMFWVNVLALCTRIVVRSGPSIENAQALIQVMSGVMQQTAPGLKGKEDSLTFDMMVNIVGQMGLTNGSHSMQEYNMFMLLLSDAALGPLWNMYTTVINKQQQQQQLPPDGSKPQAASAAPRSMPPAGFGFPPSALPPLSDGKVDMGGMMSFFSKLQGGTLDMADMAKLSADMGKEMPKDMDPKDLEEILGQIKGNNPMQILQLLAKEESKAIETAVEKTAPTTAPAPAPAPMLDSKEKQRLEALEAQLAALTSTLEALTKGQATIQNILTDSAKKQDRIDKKLSEVDTKQAEQHAKLTAKVAQLEAVKARPEIKKPLQSEPAKPKEEGAFKMETGQGATVLDFSKPAAPTPPAKASPAPSKVAMAAAAAYDARMASSSAATAATPPPPPAASGFASFVAKKEEEAAKPAEEAPMFSFTPFDAKPSEDINFTFE